MTPYRCRICGKFATILHYKGSELCDKHFTQYLMKHPKEVPSYAKKYFRPKKRKGAT